MKETVAAFLKRTGKTYAPGPELRGFGRLLRPAEACPTLYRYPGPEGLQAALQGTLRRLAPQGRAGVWLSTDIRGCSGQPAAVRLFGTLAVLEPLRLSPVKTRERNLLLGENRRLDDLAAIAWTPASALRKRLAWDRLRTSDEVARAVGRRYAEERARTLDQLHAYLEELDALRRAGVTGDASPWCSLRSAERRKRLAAGGIRPIWTQG